MAKVFLSHSSQSGNIGAVAGYVESEVNKKINDVADRELKRHLVETMRNMPGDTFTQRIARSNGWNADIHSCSHTNANNGNTKGITYVGCFNPANANLKSTRLANLCAVEVRKAFPERSVRIVQYTFAEVTQTDAPAVYFEWGFHDNLEDCKWILANIEKLGIVQIKGHLAYLGIAYKPIIPPVVVPPVTIPPVAPPQPVTAIVVGKTYKLVTLGYSGSDGTGTEVQVASVSAKCLKIEAGAKYAYGMDYIGAGFVSAWFSASSIR